MLGDFRISSNTTVSEIRTREARTRLATECGPVAIVKGIGQPDLSKNCGCENQIAISTPISSYVRINLLYERRFSLLWRRRQCWRAKLTIALSAILFLLRKSNVAANSAVAPADLPIRM
jgi:hypothetical protein